MTINKYYVLVPQHSEDSVQLADTDIDKEIQRQEALKQAQIQGGFDSSSDA
mgnify:CR=1 FL=1